jgi:hypothetical protein
MTALVRKNRPNLTRICANLLQPLGFCQHGRFFVREQAECFQIIDIQGSRYSPATYINQTVWFKVVGEYPGGEGAFQFSARMESHAESERLHWEDVLDASGDLIPRAAWAGEVARLVQSRLPLFDLVATPALAIANEASGLLTNCWLGTHLLPQA